MRENCSFARPTHRGSGFAHHSRTSKPQKPHAEYDIYQHTMLTRIEIENIHIHKASTCLPHSWLRFETARFLCVKKVRKVNASHHVFRPTRIALDRASA